MLFKTLFLLPHLFCYVEIEFSWFHNMVQSSEMLILQIEMLLEFQNKNNVEITGFWLMHFGFALDLSEINLWNIDLLDTHLDLLDTNIPGKDSACFQDVFKTSSRRFQDMFQDVFKICVQDDISSKHLEDVFSLTIFVFQDALKTSRKTNNCYAEDVLNM